MQRWLNYWLTEGYLWNVLDVYEFLFGFSSGTSTKHGSRKRAISLFVPEQLKIPYAPWLQADTVFCYLQYFQHDILTACLTREHTAFYTIGDPSPGSLLPNQRVDSQRSASTPALTNVQTYWKKQI